MAVYAGDDNEGDGYLESVITLQDHPVFTISTPEQSTVRPTNDPSIRAIIQPWSATVRQSAQQCWQITELH